MLPLGLSLLTFTGVKLWRVTTSRSQSRDGGQSSPADWSDLILEYHEETLGALSCSLSISLSGKFGSHSIFLPSLSKNCQLEVTFTFQCREMTSSSWSKTFHFLSIIKFYKLLRIKDLFFTRKWESIKTTGCWLTTKPGPDLLIEISKAVEERNHIVNILEVITCVE